MPQDNEYINGLKEIKKELNDMRHTIMDLAERVSRLEGRIDELSGKNQLLITLIKNVILPLIIILGGLVGIKLVIP